MNNSFNVNPKTRMQEMTLLSAAGEQKNNNQAGMQDYLKNLKSPTYLKKESMERARRKYEILLNKISFLDLDKKQDERQYKYKYDGMMPFIYFFKYMAKKPDGLPAQQLSNANRLRLWIPDTIVVNERDMPPFWLYSSMDGYVFRTDTFSSKNIVTKLGNYTSPDELVAVVKKPHYREQELIGNDVKLLSTKELGLMVATVMANRGELSVIQKFIKSNGPKAFICRTVWRKEKNPYSWIITNKNDFYSEEIVPEIQKYCTTPRIMNSCTIVQTSRGKQVEETVPYLQNLIRYLEIHLGILMNELIGDFIKDESGTWWLINIKGFIMENPDEFVDAKVITHWGDEDVRTTIKGRKMKYDEYKKVKLCKYCEYSFPVVELNQKMTLKMILQTDRHLLHRGYTFDWLKRSDVKHIDSALLYQEHKVCKSCYKLYKETERLMDVEFQFGKQVGIPVSDETKYHMVSLSNVTNFDMSGINMPNMTAVNKIHDNPVKPRMPQDWGNEIAKESYLFVMNNEPQLRNGSEKTVTRFRMMVLIHSIRDLPETLIQEKNYYIEYSIFDQKIKYKIDFNSMYRQGKSIVVNINKIRVFYFFSVDRKRLNEFLNDQKTLTMYLYCDRDRIGAVDFELADFLSDKVIKREFYKFFSGKDLYPILSWGTSVSMGISEGGKESIERTPMRQHRTIHIPARQDYYSCEPFPIEWISLISERKDPETQMNFKIVKDKNNAFGVLDKVEFASPLKKSKTKAATSINFRPNTAETVKSHVKIKNQNNTSSISVDHLDVDDTNERRIEDEETTMDLDSILSKEIKQYEKTVINVQKKPLKRKIYY